MKYRFILLLLIFSVPFAVEGKTVKKKPRPEKKTDHETEANSGIFKDLEISLTTSGEVYFFQIGSSLDDNEDLDFSNASNRMKYKFKPVYLASLQGYVKWNSLKFDAGYRTNRFFSRNGSADRDGDPASGLTTNKFVSSILNLGINLFNLNATYRSVQFDCGQADVYTINTNSLIASGQIKMNITDIDIFYDCLKTRVQGSGEGKISLGYKYMEYSVPRIIYYFRDAEPGELEDWVYAGETAPQEVRTRSHMLGGMFKWLGLNFCNPGIMEFGMYLGEGRTEFVINGYRKEAAGLTLVVSGKAGFFYNFGDSDTKCRISSYYEFNLIFDGDFSQSKTRYTTGAKERYHGIILSANVFF